MCLFSDIRWVIIVTKIDRVCQYVEQDIRNVFHSSEVDAAVTAAHSQFGAIHSNIFPMQVNLIADIIFVRACSRRSVMQATMRRLLKYKFMVLISKSKFSQSALQHQF